MKLARRIAMAMALVVVVVLGLQAVAAVRRERDLFEGDMERDHLVAARRAGRRDERDERPACHLP